MQVSDRLAARTPTQIRVDRAALDGARAHESNLDDDVVEAARFQTRQSVHLCARLHLKYTHGICRT